MLDAGGALRPVFGMPASASLGDPALANVHSFACSSTLCIAKTESALAAFVSGVSGSQGAGIPSPILTPCACPGPALIALDSSSGAWIFFPMTRQFARWANGTLAWLNFAPAGDVLSLRSTTDGFDYAFAQESGRGAATVWIAHYTASDGSTAIVDSLGLMEKLAGAVLLFDGGSLQATPDGVILRRPDAQEMLFPLAGARGFQASATGFVEIAASTGMWILRTDPGSEGLSLLPGVLPKRSPRTLIRLGAVR